MAHLGDLLLYSNRLPEAGEHYRKALETEPQLAHPYEGLAMIAARNDNPDQAEEYLRLALEQDSANYLVHYRWAELQMNRLGFMEDLPANVANETLDPIERSLLRTIELAPAFDRAHYLLATLCLRSGRNADIGIEAIQKALVLKPQDFYYRLALADLQMEVQDYEGAEQTLTQLAQAAELEMHEYVASRLDYLRYLKRR